MFLVSCFEFILIDSFQYATQLILPTNNNADLKLGFHIQPIIFVLYDSVIYVRVLG